MEIFLPFPVLRGPAWWKYLSSPPLTAPFPTLGEPLLSPLQRLSGPLPSFVALRGNLFFFRAPFWWIPFPTLGEPLLSPLQRLSGPLPFFVALRGNLFFFWRPFWTFVSLADPLANPLVALRRPFGPSWKSFFLLAPLALRFLGGPLSSPLQPLSGPSPSFVALRGNLFAFSRPSWTRLVEILSPLPDPWRTPLEPPPTP